ncbi:MAG: DUF4430 domain-containing protein [Lachnospiraceae bacterium]|nr:DUF4430 domain-containing protein [Lachnospiraceae bacterium]
MNEETKKQGNKKLLIGGIIMALLIICFAAVYLIFAPKPTEGAKAITVTVVDDSKEETSYSINTDAEFLREALDGVEGLEIIGTEGDYGLYIESVNGLLAQSGSESGTYWAIYVNGEYGQYSLDAQPVTDGDNYSLVYESY